MTYFKKNVAACRQRNGYSGRRVRDSFFWQLLVGLVFFLSSSSFLLSQNVVQPPQPLCLSGDTLVWNLPANTCGAFQAYEIYRATAATGPYTLIASVTDPLSTRYVDPNPSSELRFYYMLSSYDCPGWGVQPSDTISNEFPDEVTIAFVTVTGNQVYIQWAASNSPQTSAYLVYRQIGGNVDLIDTVFNALEYIDIGADPSGGSEVYYLLAMDACGNTSAFVSPHHTLFLEVEQDFCQREMLLSWNTYEGWPEGVSSYRIWVSRDGGSYEEVADLPQGSMNYSYKDLVNGSEYCFYVEALAEGLPYASASNEVCLTANTAPVPDQLALLNATVIDGNTVEIIWQWNEDFVYQGAQLGLSQGGDILLPVAPPLTYENTYTYTQASAGQAAEEYALVVQNECGETFSGGLVRTVFLEAEVLADGVQLSWTPFELSDAMVSGYRVYREDDGSLQLLQQVGGAQHVFTDESAREVSLYCYRVEAIYQRVLPGGGLYEGTSFSNMACASPEVKIYLPNVFAPEGVNNRFKPGLPAANVVSEYTLKVFDRYGQLLFVSDSPEKGWDGNFRSQPMPMGVYVYYLELVTYDGEYIEKKGDLILLR